MLPAVRVQNLGKSFRLGLTHAGSLRELVNRAGSRLTGRAPRAVAGRIPEHAGRAESDGLFWALRDVSFDVQPGQVVGLIGRNGAGKSTLLKILSRITYPSTGRVEIHGRVASLLEVGTGFHPELTGRENVYLNGTILGMTKREVARSFDEIVAFAEVDKFIDTPVKRYSSGMHLRLAFAVAAHLQPEILFVDEVLAVGDAAFQQKCLTKMSDLGQGGRTILFVSHNMSAIRQLTNECVVIQDGRILFHGPSSQGVDRYLAQQKTAGRSALVVDLPRAGGSGDRSVEFVSLEMIEPSNGKLEFGENLSIAATVRAREDVSAISFSTTVHATAGGAVATGFTEPVEGLSAGQSRTFHLRITDPGLSPGEYWFSIGVLRKAHVFVDVVQEVLHFEATSRGRVPAALSEWRTPVWGNLRMSMGMISPGQPVEVET